MSTRILATALGLAVLGGCVTERRPAPPPEALPVEVGKTWSLFSGAEPIGRLVELELQRDEETLRWYRVETRDGQWVGYATSAGSFYRYLPFEAEEKWVGVHPMDEGLSLLFGRDQIRWIDDESDEVETRIDFDRGFGDPKGGPVPASFRR